MGLINEMKTRLDSQIELGYSLIRTFLGLALFIRGAIMFSDPGAITRLAGANQWYWLYSFIIINHIICGLMLAAGVFTRIASLLQIPILITAVFVVHFKDGLLHQGQSLELSALVLILLLNYLIFGAGALSIDNYLKKRKSKI
ncbi:MAG: DoxX family protein [Ignavibacteria bacterium]|nr:DoxX family protein [Ignavibacteria bacterium]